MMTRIEQARQRNADVLQTWERKMIEGVRSNGLLFNFDEEVLHCNDPVEVADDLCCYFDGIPITVRDTGRNSDDADKIIVNVNITRYGFTREFLEQDSEFSVVIRNALNAIRDTYCTYIDDISKCISSENIISTIQDASVLSHIVSGRQICVNLYKQTLPEPLNARELYMYLRTYNFTSDHTYCGIYISDNSCNEIDVSLRMEIPRQLTYSSVQKLVGY